MNQTTDDVLAIQTILHRYATAIDERAWDALDDVFADGATIDFALAGGPPATDLGSFRSWLRAGIGQVPITRHHLTNIVVEVHGDAARSRAYLHNPLADASGQVFLTIGGTYDDRWRRTDAGWRIVARTFTPTWFEGDLPDGIRIGGT